MSDAPDISKVISLIMQNPTLISEIAALTRSTDGESKEKAESVSTKEEEIETAAVPSAVHEFSNKERRRELLNAMKPYLSESRRSALDSMSSILDILEVMNRR